MSEQQNIDTSITIKLLPDGKVHMTSLFMGRPDSSYATMTDQQLQPKLQALLLELREQLKGVSPR